MNRFFRLLGLQRLRKLTPNNNCIMDSSCSISQEGIIDNLQDNPSSIVLGAHTHCRGRLLVYAHAGKIAIGDWCYLGVRSEIWSMNSITIGNRVLISHDVNIHDGSGHSIDSAERHEHFRSIVTSGHPQLPHQVPGLKSDPIIIEDDVWISFGVTILRGVRIGKGSVIAANSIVTSDVPPNMLYYNKVVPHLKPLG
ncbi:acyltransferase [Synechococcus sp. Cu2B8-bc1011]|uniref:acyltransferase n=1 Tax=Synechococcus sp. Cu2B8-bc1011 TaxID=3093725 RepID=UPI0039AFAFDE